jgi:hypothetical protein
MPVTDAITYLHGTPATPAVIFTATDLTDVGAYVLNFGAASAGTSYPYLPEFPSIAEKGYKLPPEIVGDGGVEMGIHLVISTAVTVGSGMTTGNLIASTGSADSLGTIIASRSLTLAQLAVVGAHYFVPVPMAAVLQYLGVIFQAVTDAAGGGTGIAWFGPKTGGEQ